MKPRQFDGLTVEEHSSCLFVAWQSISHPFVASSGCRGHEQAIWLGGILIPQAAQGFGLISHGSNLGLIVQALSPGTHTRLADVLQVRRYDSVLDGQVNVADGSKVPNERKGSQKACMMRHRVVQTANQGHHAQDYSNANADLNSNVLTKTSYEALEPRRKAHVVLALRCGCIKRK